MSVPRYFWIVLSVCMWIVLVICLVALTAGVIGSVRSARYIATGTGPVFDQWTEEFCTPTRCVPIKR